jgi:methylglyoxal synthase
MGYSILCFASHMRSELMDVAFFVSPINCFPFVTLESTVICVVMDIPICLACWSADQLLSKVDLKFLVTYHTPQLVFQSFPQLPLICCQVAPI